MKVKVVVYSEQVFGSPLQILSNPVIGEANDYPELTQMIVTALQSVVPYITNQEVITQVESNGINRWLDIVNLQVWLRNQGLVLQVTEIVTEPATSPDTGYFIEIISPLIGLLPVSTSFYDDSANYDIAEIVDTIANKFSLGDPNIVPTSDLRSILNSMQDMKARGLDIFAAFKDQLENKLAEYGFQMYYVRVD